jgi:hypothetical protein
LTLLFLIFGKEEKEIRQGSRSAQTKKEWKKNSVYNMYVVERRFAVAFVVVAVVVVGRYVDRR